MEGLWCTGVDIPDELPPPYSEVDAKQRLLERAEVKKPDLSQEEREFNEKTKHLPKGESSILRRQLRTPRVQLAYYELYQFATAVDLCILSCSTVCAILGGAIFPIMTVSTIIF